MSPLQRPHTRASRETAWRLVCCSTRRHKNGAIRCGAASILEHAKRLFPHRTGAGSCTAWAPARHRTSAARRSSRSDRSGGSSITHRGGSYTGPYDGNLRKPVARPHRRFRQPQHSSARIHNRFMVRQRTGIFQGVTEGPRTLLHVLARGVFARSFQCHASSEQRLRHPDRCRLASGPCPHYTVARAEAALPKNSSLRVQTPGPRGLRCCRTSSALRAFCSNP